MKSLCILIRVYNRIEDLENCIDIIRDTWALNDYYIIVVSNGENKGYIVPDKTKNKIDKFISLTDNAGHLKGNAQLLLNGISNIPANCDYTIILEADTWIYNDTIIDKYINQLDNTGAVWASAQWYNSLLSLSTDFAIIKTTFAVKNLQIFNFTIFPEYYVAYYLRDHGFKHIYITEIKSINFPVYIKKFPYAPEGRFGIFPKMKMVTYHVECLRGKMDEKKHLFNVITGVYYFDLPQYKNKNVLIERMKMSLAVAAYSIFPHKSWFVKTKKLKFD